MKQGLIGSKLKQSYSKYIHEKINHLHYSLKEIKEDPFYESEGPQAVASLGVLGTFLGITYSLFSFNSNGIEQSVPALLDGMKTAFVTSILGMCFSLFMKQKQKNAQKNKYIE